VRDKNFRFVPPVVGEKRLIDEMRIFRVDQIGGIMMLTGRFLDYGGNAHWRARS